MWRVTLFRYSLFLCAVFLGFMLVYIMKDYVDGFNSKRAEIIPLHVVKLGLLAKKGPNYFKEYIGNLSDSEVNTIAKYFEIRNLTSPLLQRKFLNCPGFEICKHFSSSDGFIHLPGQLQKCKSMSFQNEGIETALVSWPGSGNSWVRQLLEATTGIYTGSTDCDLAYIGAGMVGEGIATENVIAVKSHFEPPTWTFPKQIIYIVRNPFDVIVADWNREMSKSSIPHISEAKADFFGSYSKWDARVKKDAYWWRDHVVRWLQSSRLPTLVLKYENLQTDLLSEIRKIMDFLKYPYAEKDLQCTVKSSMERFHRKHTQHFDKYTVTQKDYIIQQLKLANVVLQKYNIHYPESV